MKLSALSFLSAACAFLGTSHAQVDKGSFVSQPYSYLVFESNGRPGKASKGSSSSSVTSKSGKSDVTSSSFSSKSSKCFSTSPDRIAEIDEVELSMSYSMSSLSFDASTSIYGSKGSKSYSESGSSKGSKSTPSKGKGSDCPCNEGSATGGLSKANKGKGSKSKANKSNDSGVDTRVPNCSPTPPPIIEGTPNCSPTPPPIIEGISTVIARDDAVSLVSTSPPVVIDVLQNDASIPSGAELFISSVSIVDQADGGACNINGDAMSIVYTPPVSPRFVGDVVCQYETCIVGQPTCATATGTISLLPQVVAEDDSVSVLSTSIIGESINVLENDYTIPSGYPLIVQTITSPPAFGTAVVSIDNTDVLYTPPSDFVGEVTFEYEACYVGGDSCDTAVVTVTVVPVVDAVDDAASVSILASITGEVLDVLANDVSFPSGKAINVTAITRNPSEGTSTIAADKSAVVYAPPSDFIGEVTFEYQACLEDGTTCDKANVTISVEPEVVAVDDAASVVASGPQVSINVLSNDDTIPVGRTLIIKGITDGPALGTSVVSGDRLAILYTPPPSDDGFIGEDFEYQACLDDGVELICDTAIVTVSVDPVFIDSVGPTSSGPSTTSPSFIPTEIPTLVPSLSPSKSPTDMPTQGPSFEPTADPSFSPTTMEPTTTSPSSIPTDVPTSLNPTSSPTLSPSSTPTSIPTSSPSATPTFVPSNYPTNNPSSHPTLVPSFSPSKAPTFVPTFGPTSIPTSSPSVTPTFVPSDYPTNNPSGYPTTNPTDSPSLIPTDGPSTPPPVQILVCTSDKYFRDALDRTCEYYLPNTVDNISQSCPSADPQADGFVPGTTQVNGVEEASDPWQACCLCGGGSIGPIGEAVSNDDPDFIN